MTVRVKGWLRLRGGVAGHHIRLCPGTRLCGNVGHARQRLGASRASMQPVRKFS